MCLGIDISSFGESIQTNLNKIEDVSVQFKADVNAIYGKNKDNFYITLMLDEFVSVLLTTSVLFRLVFIIPVFY